jgi:phage terminase large subunit GpA-like protein
MKPDESEISSPRTLQLSDMVLIAAKLLRPPPKRTAGEWAEVNRRLPRGSAEAGAWRTSRTPYFRAMHEAVIDPRYRRIVGVLASQSGKTEWLLNELGRRLDDDPAPCMFIAASQRQAESISNSRVTPMLQSTPSLAAKLDTRKAANKVTEKYIAGQRLGFAWAGSATEMSSHPCALVVVDERDRMGADVAGEGDPVALAEARVTTYPGGRVIVASSPTLEGASPIWELWKNGTACKWSWPCPECETFFTPEFKLLHWPKECTPQRARREARLACPSCGALIEDRHKVTMNAAGRFEMTGDPDSDTASFWVSGLASPWRSWGDCAKRWLEAYRSGEAELMQATLNTVFGELYKLKGEAPPVSVVQELRGGYKFDELPAQARIITAGVDMQLDRLYYVIRAWGAHSTSWLLRHGELFGPTDQLPVWNDLAALLEAVWGSMRIRSMFVDSGFRPDMAYAFARRFPSRVLPCKGHFDLPRPVQVTRIDLNKQRNPARTGTSLAHIDASYFKSWVHGRLVWPLDQPGAWHLPIDATDDYCAQLVAESRITKASGKVLWVRDGKKAQHYLDCEAYAAAAAHALNVHLLRAKDDQASPKNDGTPPGEAPREKPAPARRAPVPDNPAAQVPRYDERGRRVGLPGRNWTRNW